MRRQERKSAQDDNVLILIELKVTLNRLQGEQNGLVELVVGIDRAGEGVHVQGLHGQVDLGGDVVQSVHVKAPGRQDGREVECWEGEAETRTMPWSQWPAKAGQGKSRLTWRPL